MIDRTTFDLRLAEHRAAMSRINNSEWKRQGAACRRPVRRAAAATLGALAARLDPADRALAAPERRVPA
jgi:hypothetical protein